MPQIIVLAIAGAGLYVGFRWARKQLRGATEKAAAQEQREKAVGPRDLGTLERDPATGVYRPRT